MPKAKTVDEYVLAQPEGSQAVLERVRLVLRRALPKAEEVISYSIPAFRQDKRIVIFFAGWKEHFAIYPTGPALVAKFKKELEPYEYNSKGTIRFPLDGKIPVGLLGRIAKFRLAEVTAQVRERQARKRR